MSGWFGAENSKCVFDSSARRKHPTRALRTFLHFLFIFDSIVSRSSSCCSSNHTELFRDLLLFLWIRWDRLPICCCGWCCRRFCCCPSFIFGLICFLPHCFRSCFCRLSCRILCVFAGSASLTSCSISRYFCSVSSSHVSPCCSVFGALVCRGLPFFPSGLQTLPWHICDRFPCGFCRSPRRLCSRNSVSCLSECNPTVFSTFFGVWYVTCCGNFLYIVFKPTSLFSSSHCVNHTPLQFALFNV